MTATVAAPQPAALTIPTRLFGPLTVPPDSCITFPDGLPGFGGVRRFVLLPSVGAGLYWMQSVDDGSLVFLTVDPFRVVPGYAFQVPDGGDPETVAVLAIVTLGPKGGPCTANLRGPLVIDFAARRGRQLVQTEAPWDVLHPVDLEPLLPADDSSSGRAGR